MLSINSIGANLMITYHISVTNCILPSNAAYARDVTIRIRCKQSDQVLVPVHTVVLSRHICAGSGNPSRHGGGRRERSACARCDDSLG